MQISSQTVLSSIGAYVNRATHFIKSKGQQTQARFNDWCCSYVKSHKNMLRHLLASNLEKAIVSLQEHLPYHTFSRLFGMVADCRITPVKNFLIRSFVWLHGINLDEAEKHQPKDYATFGEFFTRRLQQGARTIASEEQLASPVDGTISQIGTINNGQLIQAKKHNFSLKELLGGNEQLAKEFDQGSFTTIYLSPTDYHRIHMPLEGDLRETIHVPGKLFSVSPKNVEKLPGLFARNERLISIFDTDKGPMAVIMVGAINVSSIQTEWGGLENPHKKGSNRHKLAHKTFGNKEPHHYHKGDDIGTFRLGSTVIVLLGKEKVEWLTQLSSGNQVKMGQPLGKTMPPQ